MRFFRRKHHDHKEDHEHHHGNEHHDHEDHEHNDEHHHRDEHEHHDHEHHDEDHHGDDHNEHHDDHDEDHEHDDLHLEMHRAVDELGKYAIDINISSEKGIPKDNVKKFIEDLMTQSMKRTIENGADLVGHIKSIMITNDGNIMSSIIDERAPIRIKDNMDSDIINEAKFTMHVIVHGIWDDKVRGSVLDVLPSVFDSWNIPYKIIADYYETEKSMDHHT